MIHGTKPAGEARPVDLHVHTTRSDGERTPAEIVNGARGSLDAVSICDHDTVRAYAEIPDEPGIAVLPGIEISTTLGGNEIHLLGYFPNGLDDSIREGTLQFEEARRERVHAGVRALRNDGIALRWEELGRAVGEGVPCRTHVAQVLLEMGYARSATTLFRQILNRGYFPQPRLDTAEAVRWVIDRGGVPVWAHPRLDHVEAELSALVEAGLQGLEVFGPPRRAWERERFFELVDQHEIGVTGGSDFHRETRRRRLGRFRFGLDRLPRSLDAWFRDRGIR